MTLLPRDFSFMPVQFTCPRCDQLLTANPSQVGQAVRCTKCSGGVVVPPPASEPFLAPNSTKPASQVAQGVPRVGHVSPPKADKRAIPAPTPPMRTQSMWRSTVAVKRTTLVACGVLLIVTSTATFFVGWSLGRSDFRQQVASEDSSPKRLHGRLTYLTRRGREEPDAEAVVLALPKTQTPDEKLDISVLRPEAPAPLEQHPTIRGIRSIGGDATRADQSGEFELNLARPGEYRILLLSSHIARSREPSTTEIVELGRYFKQADKLLGDNDFLWEKRLVRDDKRFDHLFEGR